MRPPLIALPSRLVTTPSFPRSMVMNFWMSIWYCQGHRPKWMPGGRVSAWTPASPLRATIAPSGSALLAPKRTNFLVTMPMASSGMLTIPNSLSTSRCRTSARRTRMPPTMRGRWETTDSMCSFFFQMCESPGRHKDDRGCSRLGSGSGRPARAVRGLGALGQGGELVAQHGALEQLVEDLGDALLATADDGQGRHRFGELLGESLVSEGLESRDERRFDGLALVDRGLDLGRELLELERLELGLVSTFRSLAGFLGRQLESRDFRRSLLVRQVVGRTGRVRRRFRSELVGLLLGVVGDEREVESELPLRVDALQLEGGALRLRTGLLGRTLQLLGLLHEVQLAPLFREDEGVLDDGPLRGDEELLDVGILHLDAEDLGVVDPHVVLGEHRAGAGLVLRVLGTEDDVPEDRGVVAVELLDAQLLHRRADARPHRVAEELDVVVHREPALGVVTLEVDAVGDLDVEAAEVLGLDLDDVADHVVGDLQVHVALQLVGRLRLARREREDLRVLVVLEHVGARTLDDPALAALADEQHGVAGPERHGDGAVVLGVEDDRTRSGELRLAVEGDDRQRVAGDAFDRKSKFTAPRSVILN